LFDLVKVNTSQL